MKTLLTVVLAVAFAVPIAAAGVEDELQRHARALDNVCTTGVTPELRALYAVAVKAREAVRSGPGQQPAARGPVNFGGPQDPDRAYLACIQSR